MTQHLVVMMAAAPLLVLGAPVTLAFRASSDRTRRRIEAIWRRHERFARAVHAAVEAEVVDRASPVPPEDVSTVPMTCEKLPVAPVS